MHSRDQIKCSHHTSSIQCQTSQASNRAIQEEQDSLTCVTVTNSQTRLLRAERFTSLFQYIPMYVYSEVSSSMVNGAHSRKGRTELQPQSSSGSLGHISPLPLLPFKIN